MPNSKAPQPAPGTEGGKYFHGTLFGGKVASYDNERGFLLKYEDGDAEHVTQAKANAFVSNEQRKACVRQNLVGEKGGKSFDGKIYEGEIKSYFPEAKGFSAGLWHVSYSDGDKEDLGQADIQQFLMKGRNYVSKKGWKKFGSDFYSGKVTWFSMHESGGPKYMVTYDSDQSVEAMTDAQVKVFVNTTPIKVKQGKENSKSSGKAPAATQKAAKKQKADKKNGSVDKTKGKDNQKLLPKSSNQIGRAAQKKKAKNTRVNKK